MQLSDWFSFDSVSQKNLPVELFTTVTPPPQLNVVLNGSSLDTVDSPFPTTSPCLLISPQSVPEPDD